jgi:hypothetical protein
MKYKSLLLGDQVNSSTNLPNNMRHSVDGQTEQHHENVSSHGKYLLLSPLPFVFVDFQ